MCSIPEVSVIIPLFRIFTSINGLSAVSWMMWSTLLNFAAEITLETKSWEGPLNIFILFLTAIFSIISSCFSLVVAIIFFIFLISVRLCSKISIIFLLLIFFKHFEGSLSYPVLTSIIMPSFFLAINYHA